MLGPSAPSAKVAVPALLAITRDEYAWVRLEVTNALVQIDPETAARAGMNANSPGLDPIRRIAGERPRPLWSQWQTVPRPGQSLVAADPGTATRYWSTLSLLLMALPSSGAKWDLVAAHFLLKPGRKYEQGGRGVRALRQPQGG